MKEWFEGVGVGVLISVSIGSIVLSSKVRSMKQEAVDAGHAEYDSKTGEWKWKAVPEKSDVLQTNDN